MLAAITTGFGSLKAAKDIIQGLNAVMTKASIDEVKISLQGLILDAQQGLFEAQEAQTASAKTIAELEQKIVQFENWAAEKEHYELADAGQGALAYRQKEGMKNGEPPHWICPQCYQQAKKSILQPETVMPGRVNILRCWPCKLELVICGQRR